MGTLVLCVYHSRGIGKHLCKSQLELERSRDRGLERVVFF